VDIIARFIALVIGLCCCVILIISTIALLEYAGIVLPTGVPLINPHKSELSQWRSAALDIKLIPFFLAGAFYSLRFAFRSFRD